MGTCRNCVNLFTYPLSECETKTELWFFLQNCHQFRENLCAEPAGGLAQDLARVRPEALRRLLGATKSTNLQAAESEIRVTVSG